MLLWTIKSKNGVNILKIGFLGSVFPPKLAFATRVVKTRKIVKRLFFIGFQQTFFLKYQELDTDPMEQK